MLADMVGVECGGVVVMGFDCWRAGKWAGSTGMGRSV